MKNHLIIGIGRTGETTLCSLRKRIYEEFRSDSPKGCAYVEYLYIDSDEAKLNNENDWTVLGKSVQLLRAQRFHIKENFSCTSDNTLCVQIRSLAHSLVNISGNNDVTFHIISSLEDSLTSKILIPLVELIHTHFYYVNCYRTILYLETNQGEEANNLLHCINELALKPNKYFGSPFHRAYIYNNVEASNKLADFLFWKIIECQGLLKCEYDDYYVHGMVVPAQDGNPALSLRFMTFGFCMVETCERAFLEYAASRLAQQTSPLIAGERHSIQAIEKNDIRNLLLSDEYLTLSKPTPKKETEGRRWRSISSGMEMYAEHFKQDVMSEYQGRQWIAEFDHICDEYYHQNFRSRGVEEFYKDKEDDIHSIAREIIDRIETVVYDKWKYGEFTANDACDYVTIIKNYCSQRIVYFSEKINECQQRLNGELLQEKEELLQRWNDMGWFHIVLTGCNKKIFETYSHVKCESMIVSAQICAYQFAISLVKEIIQNLGWLHEYTSQLKQTIIYFAAYAGNRANAEMSEIQKESEGLWRICKREEVMKALDEYFNDKGALRQRAETIRTIIASHVNADDHPFQQLAFTFDENVYEEAIKRCKEDLHFNRNLHEYLHKDIYSVLRDTVCTNDSDTEAFAKELLQRAGLLVTWNEEEMGRAYKVDSCCICNVIMMPSPYNDADSELSNTLIGKLSQQCYIDGRDILSGYRNAITLVSLAWSFPYRYILQNNINK